MEMDLNLGMVDFEETKSTYAYILLIFKIYNTYWLDIGFQAWARAQKYFVAQHYIDLAQNSMSHNYFKLLLFLVAKMLAF